ncbi:hypothetical protein NKH61_19525 [Mesorhizobium sp. M1005]|uniref:hypothetical protein n=1 Tax=unclassified Mesorhizobium TaxID=325217 RepID=UPI00333D326E
MVQDRVEGNKIYLTHEFLATMVGTRRPGVTTALQMLSIGGWFTPGAARSQLSTGWNDTTHTWCLRRRGAKSLRPRLRLTVRNRTNSCRRPNWCHKSC